MSAALEPIAEAEATLIVLDEQQHAEKVECERIVAAGIQAFEETGKALARIKAGKLYADEFKTWDEYVREKWSFGIRRAQQLIAAAEVAENTRTIVRLPSEHVARQMSGLPKAIQIEVAKTLAKRPEKITPENVHEAIKRVGGAKRKRLASAQVIDVPASAEPFTREQAVAEIEKWWAENREHLNSNPPAMPGVMVQRIIRLFQ